MICLEITEVLIGIRLITMKVKMKNKKAKINYDRRFNHDVQKLPQIKGKKRKKIVLVANCS